MDEDRTDLEAGGRGPGAGEQPATEDGHATAVEPESDLGAGGREPEAGEQAAAGDGQPTPPDGADAPAGASCTDNGPNPLISEEGSVQVAPDGAVAEAAAFMDELLAEAAPETFPVEDAQLRAVIEAIVYVAEEPLTLAQLSAALHQPGERIRGLLDQIVADFERPEHGVTVREVAGGYKMATKAEHHDSVRAFVKSLKPPLKLSLPALETLAVIAYKQPVTAPEIMEIRGVQGAGVLKTLLDRKLIAVAGRKNVIGKPMLYKTTKEFLIQFGLKDLTELPSLKEFEEIRRMAFSDDGAPAEGAPAAEAPAAVTGEPAVIEGAPTPIEEPESPADETPAKPGPEESQS